MSSRNPQVCLRGSYLILFALGAMAVAQLAWAETYLQLSDIVTSLEGESVYSFDLSRQLRKDGSGDREVQSMELSTLLTGRALSQGYIWKPWFSRLRLEGLGTLRHSSRSAEAGGRESDREAVGMVGIGRADLTLYPGSRFPFNLNLSHQEAYSDDDGYDERIYNTALNLSQQYRSVSPQGVRGNASYQFRETTDAKGSAHNNELRTSISQQFRRQGYRLDFEWLRDESQFADAGIPSASSQSFALFGDHDIRFDSRRLNVSTFVSLVDSESRGDGRQLDAGVWQLVNNVSWFPSPARDLELRSDSRFSGFETRSQSGDRSDSLEAFIFANNLSMDYRLSDNLDLDAGVNTVYEDLEGSPEILISENAGLSYEADEVPWGEWDYVWGGGLRAGLGQGDDAPDPNLDARFRQALHQKDFFLFSGKGRSTLQLGQAISLHALEDEKAPLTLTHSLDYDWKQSEAEVSDYFFFNLSDDRDLGDDNSERQQLDWQVQRDRRLQGGGTLDLDLYGQLYRVKDEKGSTISGSLNGGMTFTKPNLLGLTRLNYLLSLDVSLRKIFKSSEVEEAPSHQAAITNRLLWSYGRLSASARTVFSFSEESNDFSLFFELRRRWAAFQ